MKARPVLLLIAVTLLASSCGYFNSLYNARRQFADGERAAARGDQRGAATNFEGAIEKAAKSYRKYPNGRWSDDALHLIARARFELREFQAAGAAAQELLLRATDGSMRGDAHAIAGAAAYEMRNLAAARVHLDTAVERASSVLRGRAYLWRSRLNREAGNVSAAWADLNAISKDDPFFGAAQLDRIVFAVQQNDSANAAAGFTSLLTSNDSRRWVDTVSELAFVALDRFGPATTRSMLDTPLPDWMAAARDSVALVRAELALRGGDTITATNELTQLISRAAAGIANVARVRLVRARLAQAADPQDLRELRLRLLPAVANPHAQAMLSSIGLINALVQKAQADRQPVALFAAAEVARDELGAPLLAQRLFVAFADVAAQTPWAPKALLAALALMPDASDAPQLRQRLLKFDNSPYTAGINGGGDPEAFDLAEDRLRRSLTAARADAAQLAREEDAGIGRAMFTLDSLRIAAEADSTKASCGMMIDTLALAGVRADSVRAACLRADSVKVASFLTIDTMQLRPRTTKTPAGQRNQPVRPITSDTIR